VANHDRFFEAIVDDALHSARVGLKRSPVQKRSVHDHSPDLKSFNEGPHVGWLVVEAMNQDHLRPPHETQRTRPASVRHPSACEYRIGRAWIIDCVDTHPLWRPFGPGSNAARQSQRVAFRQNVPGPLGEHRKSWAADYTRVCQLIQMSIPDQILSVDHVGSTAIWGLLSKPVIDIDVINPNVADEAAYVPRLERIGFRLIFRDNIAGDVHRQLTLADPNTNLHVWNSTAIEPQRHKLFVAWLRSNEHDRRSYAAAKRAATGTHNAESYNDLKAAVVYDIYEHAFLADPRHDHRSRPRQVVSATVEGSIEGDRM
jgi:GrpB-like predicted nucleotidyltransferase (UPF0157 family)